MAEDSATQPRQHLAVETSPSPEIERPAESGKELETHSSLTPPLQPQKIESEPAQLINMEPEQQPQVKAEPEPDKQPPATTESEPEPDKQPPATKESEPDKQPLVTKESEQDKQPQVTTEPQQLATTEPELKQPAKAEPEAHKPATMEPERQKPASIEPEPHQPTSTELEPQREAETQHTATMEPEHYQPAASDPEPQQLLTSQLEAEPQNPGPIETHQQPATKEAEPPKPEPEAPARSLAAMMDKEAAEDKPPKIPLSLGSFKEESNRASDLSDSEGDSLQELKQLVQEFISTNHHDNISIWGIPLLKEDERSNVVLLKFLRARDFKPKEAFLMLKKTIQWRQEFKIDELLEEDLGDDLAKVVFMHGNDRDGHPVCYNVYGEFENKELYDKTFSDEEKRKRFLRWRIQFLERSIRKLDFRPGGVCTIFQVNDLKCSPGPAKRELRLATKQALQLLQDNYPEFVAKQVFINVPWWYLAFYTMISPFMTQRSKSKLVFAGPSRSAETLFKYISPEQVPIQYGGLSVDDCDCNPEFTIDDPATEITVNPASKQNMEIIIYEKCVIVWEVRVVGWDVSYGAEFVPNTEEGYTVIIQKPRKMSIADEPVVSQSFKVSELGKILLLIDNPTSKKKKLLYRFKVRPFE